MVSEERTDVLLIGIICRKISCLLKQLTATLRCEKRQEFVSTFILDLSKKSLRILSRIPLYVPCLIFNLKDSIEKKETH